MGRGLSPRLRHSCRAMPLNSSMPTSTTAHPGTLESWQAKNSRGEAKVFASYPALLSRRLSATRMLGSSSMTKTWGTEVAVAMFMAAPAPAELKYGTSRHGWDCSPPISCLDATLRLHD